MSLGDLILAGQPDLQIYFLLQIYDLLYYRNWEENYYLKQNLLIYFFPHKINSDNTSL